LAEATSLTEVVTLIEQRRMDVADTAPVGSRLAPVDSRLVVGIAGEPGAGKSTITALLVAALGPTAALLPMDGYHLPQARLVELGRRDRMGAADTFDVPGFVSAVRAVRNSSQTQYAADFDREIEEPVADALTFKPEVRTVVVEGNYLLHWPQVQNLLDLTFFVDVPADIRQKRLIERHVRFGKSPVDATAWALGPDESNASLIRSSAGRADHLIRLP
jgi:pantothenate kinase